MRTVLRWGNRWWTSGTATPIEGGADVLAAHFAESPKPMKLRLVYQPDHLETALVSCPKANRATLAAVLGEEYPALVDPARAWGHEPILPLKESFTTLLHFEREPELFSLVGELAALGLEVESAWPLLTWLDHLPAEWPGGGYTVAAVDHLRVHAYRRSAQGEQIARDWAGETALGEFGTWIASLPAADPTEPFLLVGTSPELLTRLDAHAPRTEPPNAEWLPLMEALSLDRPIARNHPAQLLPAGPLVTANRVAMAASIAFFGLAAWWGGSYGVQLVQSERIKVARAAEEAAQVRVAQQQAGERSEVDSLRQRLGSGPAKHSVAPLLRSLGDKIPREVVLSSFDLRSEAWTAKGFVAPGAPPAAFTAWAVGIGAEAPAPTTATGAFVLKGKLRG